MIHYRSGHFQHANMYQNILLVLNSAASWRQMESMGSRKKISWCWAQSAYEIWQATVQHLMSHAKCDSTRKYWCRSMEQLKERPKSRQMWKEAWEERFFENGFAWPSTEMLIIQILRHNTQNSQQQRICLVFQIIQLLFCLKCYRHAKYLGIKLNRWNHSTATQHPIHVWSHSY